MRIELAQSLMREFAERTGIVGSCEPTRYLWTDAYAVGNFLSLYEATGDQHHLSCAEALIRQVHHVLGRHRPDGVRQGWISGLPEEVGERHPTRGGLRIGKPLDERTPDQPLDPELEWERDGQYFHYLTKWIHALYRVNLVTRDASYLQWAAELATATHRAFTYDIVPGGPKRMYWKMSIDLSRPLVTSMGHHDPLDGLVTYLELQHADDVAVDLSPAIGDFDEMCQRDDWATSDALGIGGLLDDAARLVVLVSERGVDRRDLLQPIFNQSLASLRAFAQSTSLRQPSACRLAFRELGLSIGLREMDSCGKLAAEGIELNALVERVLEYLPLADQVEAFWISPGHQASAPWTGHLDINSVMLATSLLQ